MTNPILYIILGIIIILVSNKEWLEMVGKGWWMRLQFTSWWTKFMGMETR